MPFIAKQIGEHYENSQERHNTFPSSCRLIGDQAIELARYSVRVVDALKNVTTDALNQIRLNVLYKLCITLRKIGILMSNIDGSGTYVSDIKEECTLFFNLFSLYFGDLCNSTVWTIGYIVPYHAKKLWDEYQVGYGIITMQGKESKHSSVKGQLKNETNRSTSQDEKGKWHQIMRSSYARDFYLPYHFPTETYTPHSKSRNPPVDDSTNVCSCFRVINVGKICSLCITLIEIVAAARKGEMPYNIMSLIKPLQCDKCDERLSDKHALAEHLMKFHPLGNKQPKKLIPKNMGIEELRQELLKRKISIIGLNKKSLCLKLQDII